MPQQDFDKLLSLLNEVRQAIELPEDQRTAEHYRLGIHLEKMRGLVLKMKNRTQKKP